MKHELAASANSSAVGLGNLKYDIPYKNVQCNLLC